MVASGVVLGVSEAMVEVKAASGTRGAKVGESGASAERDRNQEIHKTGQTNWGGCIFIANYR